MLATHTLLPPDLLEHCGCGLELDGSLQDLLELKELPVLQGLLALAVSPEQKVQQDSLVPPVLVALQAQLELPAQPVSLVQPVRQD
jgi:hypothetical protein